MTYDTDMDIITLFPFEPNPLFMAFKQPELIRRFTTLLDCGPVAPSSPHLHKVINTAGETFAIKSHLPFDSQNEYPPPD